MSITEWQTMLGRLMLFLALVCGVIGLAIGVADRQWKLEVTGWFTGGTLLAAIAIGVLADAYFEAKRKGHEH